MHHVELSAAYKVAHSGDWIQEPVWSGYDVVTWNSSPYLADTRKELFTASSFRDQIIHQLDLLKPEFSQSRSDEAQEAFFHSDVKVFLLQYGEFALRLLDMCFRNSSAISPAAKYHFACLLGHIGDPRTEHLRREYLADYSRSLDDALRAGAQDALDFLDLV